MGWFTHVAEAHYRFGADVSADKLRERILAAIATRSDFAVVESESDRAALFKRPGKKHSFDLVRDEQAQIAEPVLCTCTSRLMRFVDDVGFAFERAADGGVVVKAMSVSRIGEGDLFKNSKNVESIMEGVVKETPAADVEWVRY